jgi:hypothetical protein
MAEFPSLGTLKTTHHVFMAGQSLECRAANITQVATAQPAGDRSKCFESGYASVTFKFFVLECNISGLLQCAKLTVQKNLSMVPCQGDSIQDFCHLSKHSSTQLL